MSPAVAKARAFLAAYKISGSITEAAAKVPIDRALHYQWLKSSPKYAAAFERAQQEFGDALEAAAISRAKDGVRKIVFWQGQPCGLQHEYSDSLMIQLLRRFKPEKYAQRTEVSGPGGEPVKTEITVTFVRAKPQP